MATAAGCSGLRETECAVCHGDFTDPKILPCAHLLCRDCLVKLLEVNKVSQCPLCLCAIVDPATLASKSCEELADGLPTDLAMAALVDSLHVLHQRHVCSVCDDVTATSFCLTCCDMLCRSCGQVHAGLSVSRHHQVHSLTSLTPARLAASRPKPCSAHPARPPEVYCPKHGAAICILCATSSHRKCPGVMNLQTNVEMCHAALTQMTSQLSKGAQDLQRAIGQLDQQLDDIDHVTQAAMTEIDVTYNRLETCMQAWRQRQQQLVKEANSQAALYDGKAILQERLSQMAPYVNLAQRAEQATLRQNTPAMMDTLLAQLHTLGHGITLPKDAVKTAKQHAVESYSVMRLERLLGSLDQNPPKPPAAGDPEIVELTSIIMKHYEKKFQENPWWS